MNVIDRIKTFCSDVSLVTYFLVCAFGAGSWIAVNGLWVELAIIVQHIPEGWSLPSYLTVIIQMANIGPLLFVIGNKYYPKFIREVPAIYVVILVGVVASALLGFVWKETSVIGGRNYSTALLVLAFFLATVDCTSSVTFLPYMAIFREVYMSPFFVGEGLSGLLPSVVAIAQGVDGGSHTGCVSETPTPVSNLTVANNTNSTIQNSGPNFSPQAFFMFLCSMEILSGLAFVGLNYLPVTQSQKVKESPDSPGKIKHHIDKEGFELCNGDSEIPLKDDIIPSEVSYLTPGVTAFLLIVLAVINGLSNGVIPAIQSYACIPYSYYIYHLTLTLSNIANPVTCFVFPFIRTRSFVVMGVLSLVYIGMCVYIITVAAQSPNVLLKCDDAGAALIVRAKSFNTKFGKISLLEHICLCVQQSMENSSYSAHIHNTAQNKILKKNLVHALLKNMLQKESFNQH